MSNRRRGKSVVLDSLPSLVTADGSENALNREARGRLHVNRETLKEILIVLVGLILVVWLFFGGSSANDATSRGVELAGSRQLQFSDSPFIIPSHFGGISGSHDGVKKAPGDKQKSGAVEGKTSKKQTDVIYQFSGQHSPDLVIVTVVDDVKKPRDYVEKIIENRLEYAQAHNYGVLIKTTSELQRFVEESHNHQSSWARVALAREALTSFPDAKWVWYLSDQSLIMEPERDIFHEFLSPPETKLETMMQRGVPIMRFENTHIRTYQNNHITDVSMVLVRNSRGVSSQSFLFRNSLAARIWLEVWSDPLYRSFQRFQSEEEVLGHIMQWHTQFLLRTAVIPSRAIASLAIKDTTFDDVWSEVEYHPNDFVAVVGCDFSSEICKREFQKFWNSRKRIASAQAQRDQAREKPQGQNVVQNQVQVQAQEKAQEKAEAAAAKAAAK